MTERIHAISAIEDSVFIIIGDFEKVVALSNIA